jgi:hypothetical protein
LLDNAGKGLYAALRRSCGVRTVRLTSSALRALPPEPFATLLNC